MKTQNSHTNQIKENLVATLRALVGGESVQVEFSDEVVNDFFAWDQGLVEEGSVALPNPNTPSGWHRAAPDLAACYLLFHDYKTQKKINHDLEEQKFFDEFEKIRVIARVKNSYRGVVKNILEKVEEDIFSGSTSLSLILLKEVFLENVLPRTTQCADDLEKNLNQKIAQAIKSLANLIASQSDFEAGVARVLEMLKEQKNSEEKEEDEKKSAAKSEKKKSDLSSFGQENVDAKEEKNLTPNGAEEGEREIEKQEKISDLREDEQKGATSIKLDKSTDYEDQIEFKNAYKIYTSKFDEVIFPQKLVSKNELEFLRNQLDLKMNKLDSISKKMTLKLKRKLLSKRNSFLEYDSSRGILDRKKLTRLVVDPLLEDVWVTHKTHEYQDTCLTILLDNSGSMRGNPIVMSAMACEIIAGILEKFSVRTEIIGFTTADWKGGKARKLWESSGRPKNPGRLNELRHIIYKHFNQKFKRAKINLGLMLKEGLLKENIDGEALLFARSRLVQQSEKRKILLVISDGTPVDDSTNSANDGDILTDHLHHVINKIENSTRRGAQNNRAQIEIVGIGIGHTTEEFYRNSITIKSLEELGDVMIEKIVDLL